MFELKFLDNEQETVNAQNGKVETIIGGDGVPRAKLTVQGSYRGKSGTFEYIRNPDGTINHRLFVPN